jgi:hypothetical protein
MVKKVAKSLLTCGMTFATMAKYALADTTPATPTGFTINLPKAADVGAPNIGISELIATIVKLLLSVAAIAFFIWLLLGGIKWITSGGDKAKTEEARNQITAALVGLVIVFAAWAIAQLINTLFGIDIFQFTIPSAVKR